MLTGKQWEKYKALSVKFKQELLTKYDSYSKALDIHKKYIYVPLQFQPERTSTPEGGRYSNQHLMIKVIANNIPDDWQIVVKENPSQLLKNKMHGERGRYAYFYEDLLAISSQVRIVPLATNQFELIDQSEAIATLTGTTGFEALFRGKPTLCFGHAWYNGCEGVFSVSNHVECKSAIEKISQGVTIQTENLALFLQSIENHSFKGYLNLKRYSNREQGRANNFNNFVEIIERFAHQSKMSNS